MLQKNEGDEMNIYEAIFRRKIVYSYRQEEIPPEVLEELRRYFSNIQNLFMGTETELKIIENVQKPKKIGIMGIKAPYYLALYSLDTNKSMMNAGFLMEQLCLLLWARGYGSCCLGRLKADKNHISHNGKQLMMTAAFGKIKKECIFEKQFIIMPEDFSVIKEEPSRAVMQLLEAALKTPCHEKKQPWRFVVYENRIHIFGRKKKKGRLEGIRDFHVGLMLSHMMIAAEELWLDVDFIRLENISQKTFEKYEYVLSAVLNG